MDERKPNSTILWRRADASADSVILFSWIVVLGLSFLVLPAPPRAQPSFMNPASIRQHKAPETSVAKIDSPDFYPWVRPVEPAVTPQTVEPWKPASKRRGGGFLSRMEAPLSGDLFYASRHSNDGGSFYGVDWKLENILARDGGTFLELRREKGSGLPYTAAEMQTSEHYGYGRYETVMQPAKGSGTVSAFFTFTGPWQGDPHDEVDIEFLGSDTTKVHFNYFKNGKVIKPATFDLPFDAADRPHLYAFDWHPDGITWYVDGEPIYATEPGDPGIPTHAGKVMLSVWTGKERLEGWHGPPTFRDGAGAQFNCISFTPMGHEGPKCSDTYQAGATYGRAGEPGLR